MVAESAAGSDRELLIIALPGVQRFIDDSRSTSDLRSGSEIVAALARRIADCCRQHGADLVIPPLKDPDDGEPEVMGVSNQVTVLVSCGQADTVIHEVHVAVDEMWGEWVRQALELSPEADVPATPGFPEVLWVRVPASSMGYRRQWTDAQRLLAARKRVRSFAAVQAFNQNLCGLSSRWAAEEPPGSLKEHERDTLGAANWVKRRWVKLARVDGFPSTPSIASAPFRRAVLRAMDDDDDDTVRSAVERLMIATQGIHRRVEVAIAGLTDGPGTAVADWFRRGGGPSVYPDWWQVERLGRDVGRSADDIRDPADAGRRAANALISVMKKRGVPAPTDHLAVLVQDLDGMGLFLSGIGKDAAGRTIPEVSASEHRTVAGTIGNLAHDHRKAVEHPALLGVPVYAGGDDLLAFVPAVSALAAAKACHDLVPDTLPRASTAVLFFHYRSGLRDVLASARALLHRAKQAPGKHRLVVGYRRRSGATGASVQPWISAGGSSSADAFAVFARDRDHRLSPRLVHDLARDASELNRLAKHSTTTYQAELARLVIRHTGGPTAAAAVAGRAAADALYQLGVYEEAKGLKPELAAQVGIFLRQEAR